MTTWTNISGGSAISESLADQAATSATNAANSASAASTSAAAAAAAKTAAEAAQVASETAETNSATSASQSASSATNSATSASQSASSATSSAASAAAALVSEGNAATSEASAQAADASATAASASSAASAVTAAAEAAAALVSQNSATSSASAANTSATNAANSATASAASASSAAADLAEFQGQYHGASASAPTTGLDVGDLWFDTSGAGVMKVYDGSSWVAAYISAAGMLAAANNLSDVSSASSSRTNLGLVIGTDVQAYDAGLADIAGLAVTDGNVIVGNGANWVAESGATARASLGLGTMATQAATSVDIDGGTIDGVTIGGTSAGAVTATSLSVTDASVVSVSSASDALRITQTGAGNALLVEDSTNPDSSPFVVNASGNVGIGTTPLTAGLSLVGTTSYAPQILARAKAADATSGYIIIQKDRAGSSVQSGDNIGIISYQAFDGTTYLATAAINANIDGTPGTNDMPGRLTFSTTADGASSPTERMRIDSSGNLLVNKTSADGARFEVAGSSTVSSQPNVAAVIGVNITSDLLLGSINGNAPFVASEGAYPLAFFTNAAERMRIDGSSGNVGIGTSSPGQKLTVAGTIESTTGGFKFPDGSTQNSAGATTGKAIAMAIVFGG